ncbi:MAG: hypothetical protein OQJ81_07300, partial [Melioribacteraceae bacterium]|nr:hypothetical protein [Melioribacteraceae bacterium]
MNTFFQKFVKVCPKTGRIRRIVLPKGFYRILFPFVGLAAVAWILLRVLTKPSRATYPCMKVATPIASSFVIWLVGLGISLKAFASMKSAYLNSSYFRTVIFLFVGVIFGAVALSQYGLESYAGSQNSTAFQKAVLEPNQPMGIPIGIFPGRVVWVHDPAATNENCDPLSEGHSYFAPDNTNQDVVDAMVSEAIQSLTGATSNSDAWGAIFNFHNNKRGKGEVGYQTGEKIFLKINATSAWWGNYNDDDLSKVYSSWGRVNENYGLSETTPQIMKSVLRQLINVVGVQQEDIYIGDPMKFIYKHIYEYLSEEFPNIHYLDHTGHTNLGRELAEKGTTPLVKYSDRG